MFLGVEIGGTKLQLGLGAGDGTLAGLWRGAVRPEEGGDGIRRQILAAYPELLASAGVPTERVRAAGVGFGGPTDDVTQSVVKSHHVAGWDGFPLAAWLREALRLPTVICNDADVAGLAEAEFGAGKGLSPVFYVTVGSGIGGGLIVDGKIYRGVGRGASEIGHVRVGPDHRILEEFASGWSIGRAGRRFLGESATAADVAEAARGGDPAALAILDTATDALAAGLRSVVALLCPQRIVIGGGVSLMGEELFFAPLRRKLADYPFEAFAGLTDVAPAALGEAVVVHGALALARQHFGG